MLLLQESVSLDNNSQSFETKGVAVNTSTQRVLQQKQNLSNFLVK